MLLTNDSKNSTKSCKCIWEFKACYYYLMSSLYVCMVNIKLKYNFMETPRKFTIAFMNAIINLRGVSTKLYFNVIIDFPCAQIIVF